MALAVVVSLVSMLGVPATPAVAAGERIVFVTGSPGPPAADVPVRQLLVGAGYQVVVIDDDAFDSGDVNGAALVMISSSVVPSKIGTFVRQLTVPVVTWEAHIYPKLGLTLAGAKGEKGSSTTVSIVAPGHPLAAGLSGTVATNTTATAFSWGRPAASAVVVARFPGSAGDPVIFAYDRGQALASGPAAAGRRVALFPTYTTPTSLTTAGRSLVTAAVSWGLGSGGPVNPPPTVSAGPDRNVNFGDPVNLDGTVNDDGPVQIRWTQSSGPSSATFASPMTADTAVTLPLPGTYDFVLTADDGTSSVSDTVRVVAQSGPGSPTVFDVWHGEAMQVRRAWWGQRHANINGLITDPDGIASATYSLNAGPWVTMGLGANSRRLVTPGGFNIDLSVASLPLGANSVRIRVVDGLGAVSERTVGFTVTTGSAAAIPFSINWSAGLGSAAVVDGHWSATSAGLRSLEVGYDRFVILGDSTWTDYEAVVPIKLHSVATQPGPLSGRPGIGVIANWTGHNNSVTPGSQPLQGFRPETGEPTPFGAILWWRTGRMELMAHTAFTVDTGPSVTFTRNVLYRMRVQVDRNGPSTTYRARLWRSGWAEPTTWHVEWTSPGGSDEPTSGSLALLAHEADVTFGNVTVTPLP